MATNHKISPESILFGCTIYNVGEFENLLTLFFYFKKRIMIHSKFKALETNSRKKMQKETRYEAAI